MSLLQRILALAICLNFLAADPVRAESAAAGAATPTVRAEIGKPVQAALELIKAKKAKEALARLRETDAVKDATPYEAYVVASVRGRAAAMAGDPAAAAAALDAAAGSPAAPAAVRPQLIAAAAEQYYVAKDYGKAAERLARYVKEGGSDPALRTLYIQSLYLGSQYATAERELLADVAADERAGRAPAEERLQLLANVALKQQDSGGYAGALEKLVAYHPKREYWLAAVDATARRAHFPDRLGLDLMRLKLATGTLRGSGEYMDMAQLSLQAGFPAEAKQIIDRGYAGGELGTGAEAARHKRLKDLAAKTLADDDKTLAQDDVQAAAAGDGTALVNGGLNYVLHGQASRGLAMMEKGLKKGGIKHPDEARLHLGYASFLAGDAQRAVAAFKTVQGDDGAAALAHLWLLHLARRP